jgi:hypothetical protein
MADETVHTDAAPVAPPGESVHLPGPSYTPVVTALGLTFAVVGIVLSPILVGIGIVIALVAVWRWIKDTRRDISELPLEH